MKKSVTIKDVAKAAGVSHATVSMVFRGETRISEQTRDRVFEIAREMNYVRNMGASNLRAGKSKLIGLIVNDLSNPVYGRMAQAAETTAEEQGYQLIISDHQWNPKAETAAIRKMCSLQARGILLCCTEQSEASLKLLQQTASPAVIALDSCPPSFTGAYIGYDVERSGRIAAKHLVEAGCKEPVLFTGPRSLRDINSFTLLKSGFLKQLDEMGIPGGEARVFYTGLSVADGRKAFHHLRAAMPAADGIFCINDLCAYGVMAGADDAGVVIGEDIAVLGIGNQVLSEIPRISLTTVCQPPEEIVKIAINELIESFEKNTVPTVRYELPPDLIIRNSSRLKRS